MFTYGMTRVTSGDDVEVGKGEWEEGGWKRTN